MSESEEQLRILCDEVSKNVVSGLLPLIRASLDEGAKSERERILKMLQDICDTDCADGITVGQYASGYDVLDQLKQRLETKERGEDK